MSTGGHTVCCEAVGVSTHGGHAVCCEECQHMVVTLHVVRL